VLVVDRAPPPEVTEDALQAALGAALAELPLSEAAARVAAELGLKKREVYQAALAMKEDEG
jgi:16S rRNA (cytidine1402-2'-O)-methyltransferase